MKQPPTKKPRSSTKYRDKREAKPPKNSEGEKDVEEDDVLSSSDSDIDMEALEKYQRGAPVDHKEIEDKKLKTLVKRGEAKIKSAAKKAVQAEILLTEEAGYLEAEGLERTFKFRQSDIVKQVDISSAQKAFSLDLDHFGPYSIDYTRNGRHLLIGGKKGHVASFDWKTGRLWAEIHLGETVRDVQWLHNETMFAVAQKKYVYIYERTGMEIHCLKNHIEVNRMEFLPYHFLLATVGNAGYLRYQDTSTGQLVAELRTRLGRCDVMAQNPWNAILHLGHSNGTVTLWSPNVTSPLVKMLCHKGPLKSAAVDPTGHYMATAGLDGMLKVWDLRTYKMLNRYITPTPVQSVSISQKGLLATAHGAHLTIWKDTFVQKQPAPYMSHMHPGSVVNSIQFCPFEDVLGYGHNGGVASILVPGSGEPNFDALESNPFATTKQRQEGEVRALLEKIQPEMITLDPSNIGTVDRVHKEVLDEERRKEWEANNPGKPFDPFAVNKARGKSSSKKRYLKKQLNIIDRKRELLREKQRKEAEHAATSPADEEPSQRSALDRFKRK